MNNRCNFCRDYKNLKRIERKYADSENCNPDSNIEMSNSYKVLLISITTLRIHFHLQRLLMTFHCIAKITEEMSDVFVSWFKRL